MFEAFYLKIHVGKYIAHPYWPEVEEMVNILKASGYNRVRSEDKREQTLRTYLEKMGMTMEAYHTLQQRAARQWYRLDNDNSESPIIIPRHQISGCLVQGCTSAPSGARFPKDALRSLVMIGDLATERTKADDVFKRFVRPCDGTGKPLSNQRSLRENEQLEEFDAEGTVEIDTANAKPDNVRALFDYSGKYIGVGASRKMGYGRFAVKEFQASPG